jgi:hypothetical protein
MNTQTQEALKMAIDEIQDLIQHIKDRQPDMLFTGAEYVIDACKEALEQPVQGIELEWYNKGWSDAKKEFIGLTDDEVDDFMFQSCDAENGYSITDLIRLVEQALRNKNT